MLGSLVVVWTQMTLVWPPNNMNRFDVLIFLRKIHKQFSTNFACGLFCLSEMIPLFMFNDSYGIRVILAANITFVSDFTMSRHMAFQPKLRGKTFAANVAYGLRFAESHFVLGSQMGFIIAGQVKSFTAKFAPQLHVVAMTRHMGVET